MKFMIMVKISLFDEDVLNSDRPIWKFSLNDTDTDMLIITYTDTDKKENEFTDTDKKKKEFTDTDTDMKNY